LYLDVTGVEKLAKSYDDTTKAIKEELLRLCWYMRGGLSYNEAHLLTPDERAAIGKIIEENLATTKETSLPFF
jgi:hypothetical protein